MRRQQWELQFEQVFDSCQKQLHPNKTKQKIRSTSEDNKLHLKQETQIRKIKQTIFDNAKLNINESNNNYQNTNEYDIYQHTKFKQLLKGIKEQQKNNFQNPKNQQYINSNNPILNNEMNSINNRLNQQYNKDYKQRMFSASLNSLKNISFIQQNLKQKLVISQYISNLITRLCQTSFFGYFCLKQSEKMTQDQTKYYFCKNLLFNYIQILRYLHKEQRQFWKRQSQWLLTYINQKLKESISYNMLKYPQMKKIYINNIQVKKKIVSANNSDKFASSIFSCFHKKQKGSLFLDNKVNNKTIKRFINFLIQQTKSGFQIFSSQMNKIFKNEEKSKNNKKQMFFIGTKIPLTAEQYSEQQIEKETFQIKMPQIMRILIKWIESLQDIMNKPEQKSYEFYKPSKLDKGNKINQMEFVKMKKRTSIGQQYFKSMQQQVYQAQRVKNKFINSFYRAEDEEQEQKVFIDKLQVNILEILNILENEFSETTSSNKSVGIFTSILSKTLDEIVKKYLVKILISFSSFYQQNKAIPFNIFDLFRSRYSGSLNSILNIYQKMKEDQNFIIIRIKNRLHTNNRDLLINFKIKSIDLICQIQLNISDGNLSQKQQCYNHFTHFLYELQRSKYGPICQAVNIISNTEDYFKYFSIEKINKLINKNYNKKKQLNVIIQKQQTNYQYSVDRYQIQKFPAFNYICSICFEYKTIKKSLFPSLKHQSKHQRICTQCILNNVDSNINKLIFPIQFEQCFQKITKQSLYTRTPKYFILVSKYQKIATCYFKCMPKSSKKVQYIKTSLNLKKIKQENLLIQLNHENIKTVFQDNYIFIIKEEFLNIQYFSHQQKKNSSKQLDYFSQFQKIYTWDTIFQYKNVLIQSGQRIVYLYKQNSALLFDIKNREMSKSVQQYLKIQSHKNKFKMYVEHGYQTLNLFGNYGDQLIYILSNQLKKVQNLYLEIYLLESLPEVQMSRLLKCSIKAYDKIKIIDLKLLKAPQLRHLCLQSKIANIPINFSSEFKDLKKLQIKFQRLDQIDLSNLNAPVLETIDIKIINHINQVYFNTDLPMIKQIFITIKQSKHTRINLSPLVSPLLENITINAARSTVQLFLNQDLPNLKQFYLASNQTYEISFNKQFKMPNLSKIELIINKINNLIFQQSHLPKLVKLNIESSKIKKMIFNFNAPLLQEIKVNQIKSSDKNQQFTSLQVYQLHLNCSFPNLRYFEILSTKQIPTKCECFDAQYLQYINLSIDLLSLFLSKQHFSCEHFLKEINLNISNFQIYSENFQFEKITTLEKITLKIQSFIRNFSFIYLPNLQYLDLHLQNVQTINFKSLIAPKLKFMKLCLQSQVIFKTILVDCQLQQLESLKIKISKVNQIDLKKFVAPKLLEIQIQIEQLKSQIYFEHNFTNLRTLSLNFGQTKNIQLSNLKASKLHTLNIFSNAPFVDTFSLSCFLPNMNKFSTSFVGKVKKVSLHIISSNYLKEIQILGIIDEIFLPAKIPKLKHITINQQLSTFQQDFLRILNSKNQSNLQLKINPINNQISLQYQIKFCQDYIHILTIDKRNKHVLDSSSK